MNVRAHIRLIKQKKCEQTLFFIFFFFNFYHVIYEKWFTSFRSGHRNCSWRIKWDTLASLSLLRTNKGENLCVNVLARKLVFIYDGRLTGFFFGKWRKGKGSKKKSDEKKIYFLESTFFSFTNLPREFFIGTIRRNGFCDRGPTYKPVCGWK